MKSELLVQLEQKVANAVEVIELLRLQLEEIEEENLTLKAEHERWRNDLTALLKRLDQIDLQPRIQVKQAIQVEEEEFMTV